MKALLIFHLKAGVRVAVRSFALLFSALLGWVMLDMNPAGVIINLAGTVYGRHPTVSGLAPVVALAFLFPLLAAPKLSHGLDGWIRHLAFDSVGNRRGMAAALALIRGIRSRRLPPVVPAFSPSRLIAANSSKCWNWFKPQDQRRGAGEPSLIAGIVSILGLFPFIQLPAAIAGLVLGIRSLRSPSRKTAIAGIVLSTIGLLVMVWLGWMAYDVISHVGLQTAIRELTK